MADKEMTRSEFEDLIIDSILGIRCEYGRDIPVDNVKPSPLFNRIARDAATIASLKQEIKSHIEQIARGGGNG